MNKYILISVLVSALTIFVLYDNFDDIENSPDITNKDEKVILMEKPKNAISIDYESNQEDNIKLETTDTNGQNNISSAVGNNYISYDNSGKFSIQLHYPESYNDKQPTKIVTISGKIGNNNYKLGIPDFLIGNGDDVTIEITDNQNHVSQVIGGDFINSISVDKQTAKVNFDPYSGNYSFEQKNSVLPFPGDPILPGRAQ